MCHKIQTEAKYIFICEIRTGSGFLLFLYGILLGYEFPVLFKNTWKHLNVRTCQSNSKLGPWFKFVYFLFPLKSSGFCYLLTNLGRRKYVFSLLLFCPPLNILLLKAVFAQATSVPDKATSYYYLRRKALQTLKIDKTENEKLSTCLFPVIISGFKPINISLPQKGTM